MREELRLVLDGLGAPAMGPSSDTDRPADAAASLRVPDGICHLVVSRDGQPELHSGRPSAAVAASAHVLESVRQMVAAGEEVGNLPVVMLRLARHYDTEVERELKTVASLIEPLALVFLGLVVGLIVSSVILPLFRVASAVH